MAKIQWKKEWRVWAALAVFFALVLVYLYYISRPPMEGGEYLWKVMKIDGPTTMELKGSGQTLTFRLVGLDVPKEATTEAEKVIEESLLGQWIRIKEIGKEKDGVRRGFAYLSGEDVHARLIRQGLATINRDAEGFDVRPYIELEQEAKRAKRGVWGQSPGGAK